MEPIQLEYLTKILTLMTGKNETVATAESCTGGLVAAAMTHIPDSSRYFRGGIVAYHNEIKERQLGISSSSLEKYGAVSKAVAEEMAIKVRKVFGADHGISTTGIAGPSGGSVEKPVGTVWIALSSGDHVFSEKLQLHGDRETIRRETVCSLLETFVKYLEK